MARFIVFDSKFLPRWEVTFQLKRSSNPLERSVFTMDSLYASNLHISSVNPSATAKKAIRRSFRARAGSWNLFRKQVRCDSQTSSSQDSVQAAPSSSIGIVPKGSSSTLDVKSERSLRIVRVISSETRSTTLVDASIAPTEVHSNLQPTRQQQKFALLFDPANIAVEQPFDEGEDDEEEDSDDESVDFVSPVSIEIDHSLGGLDSMSDISESSEDHYDGSSLDEESFESSQSTCDYVIAMLPVGEI
jgi:hypothetical protein